MDSNSFSKDSGTRRIHLILTLLLMTLVCWPQAIAAQNCLLKGKVIDQRSGEPLVGASILEVGTSNGILTDIDGNFELTVQKDAILRVSYVGFITQDVGTKGENYIEISLKEDAEMLDEVVVVGYGSQKKATLSGSVSSVDSKKLAATPVTNVSQSLIGRLPGVVALAGTSEPGYDGVALRIRGVNTFGDSNPLVVVDGVPGRSLERIDPSTIESMSVMKDASAAIYGAQAANGVIIITTKRGKQGRPTVNLSYNYGLSSPTTIPKLCDAAEYATLLNEIDKYAGNPERYSPEEIQKYRDGSDPWRYPNTDWFKETLKSTSPQTYANASISGGSEKAKYYVGVSAKTQDGVFRRKGTKYSQYDLKSNLDLKINKYVDLFMNLTGRYEHREYQTVPNYTAFNVIMRGKPNQVARWPNGLPGPDLENGFNPVVITSNETGYQNDKRYIFNGDAGINIQIPYIKGLSFKGTASLDKNIRNEKIWETPWYLYSWDGVSMDDNGEPLLVKNQKGLTDPKLTQTMQDDYKLMLSGVMSYNRKFADIHNVNVLAGVERITGGGDNFNAFRRYFNSTALDQLFAGGQEEINNSGSASKEARLNYFGRVNYDYKQKYLLEFVWRYQGSYIFEHSKRYGFFPGASLGYVISEEDFWKKAVPFIPFAKVRLSYGETGNDLISPYQYLASYSFNSYHYVTNGGDKHNQALYENVIPNKNVTWETAIQQNVGLDLQFLNGDLALTVDYFINKRKDILCKRNVSVPSSTGLSLPDENIGKVKNQGVDFNIDYRKHFDDFMLGVSFNGVYTKNKIEFWDEAAGIPDYQKSTGKSIGAGLYYNAIGIFQSEEEIENYPHWPGAKPGDIIFEDYDKNGVIDGNDKVRIDKSSVPKFTTGLNIDMAYKGFDLSVLFQGAFGGVFYETTESGDFGNFLKSFYDNRWTVEKKQNDYPRTYDRNNQYWVSQGNTFWLHKTDYIRLKNIEIGYTLPQSFTKKFWTERVRVYVNAFNILTFSPDMKDYDPEAVNGNGYAYPLNKVVNFGFNLTF